MGVWIGVITGRPKLLFAEEAAPTSDCERDYHAVSAFQIRDTLPHFLDQSHELVTANVTRLHGWHETVVEMQVRCANRGPRAFYDVVMRT